MERIKAILEKYNDKEASKLFEDSVNELFKKGFAKGVYQDYGVVADISSILGICETTIKKNIKKEEA